MTLLILSYRRARPGPDGNPVAMLDAHFSHVASHFANVLPGDTLSTEKPNVCLSFDGGYYDFYATVFPLLQKHSLRALVAISPGFIRDHTTVAASQRLEIASDLAYAQPAAAGFCTWRELEELVDSGSVAVAAHGYTHRRLDRPGADLETEIHVPRTLIGTRLRTHVSSFVLPFGGYNRAALAEAKAGYPYVLGTSGASNAHWNARVLHRISADNLRTATEPFAAVPLALCRLRRLWQVAAL